MKLVVPTSACWRNSVIRQRHLEWPMITQIVKLGLIATTSDNNSALAGRHNLRLAD